MKKKTKSRPSMWKSRTLRIKLLEEQLEKRTAETLKLEHRLEESNSEIARLKIAASDAAKPPVTLKLTIQERGVSVSVEEPPADAAR